MKIDFLQSFSIFLIISSNANAQLLTQSLLYLTDTFIDTGSSITDYNLNLVERNKKNNGRKNSFSCDNYFAYDYGYIKNGAQLSIPIWDPPQSVIKAVFTIRSRISVS